MSDPFKELVEEMARLWVPEDDTEDNRERREAAASEVGDADQRARRVRPHRLRRRRLPVLGGVDALADDPHGAGAGRANLASNPASVHAVQMTNYGLARPQIHFRATARQQKIEQSIVRSTSWQSETRCSVGPLIYLHDEKGPRLTSLLAGHGKTGCKDTLPRPSACVAVC